jgi:vitamin B12/bleomycin/antimicrobial peptide transport system ATP-binding/permease protein
MTFLNKLKTFKAFIAKAWALTQPYFYSDQKFKARALLAGIVVLNLALVYMAVLFNEWNKLFYNALQDKNAAVFWAQLGRFTYLAFIFIIMAVYRFYLTQVLQLRWRAWMTGHYLDRWLSNQAFYHLELARFAKNTPYPDNPDQRIQEDINQFTSYTISIIMGLLHAVVTLASFVGILWGLSGSFAFTVAGTSFNIHGFMVWMAVLYCVTGSVVTHFIGRPQIKLNFEQQRLEADFRHHMVRIREYSEAIALDRGETVERTQLDQRFGRVLNNTLALIKAQKNLVWFTSFFGQAAVVFPFVVAAPRFFSGAIPLGALTQIASAFGHVQGALSWFVDSYGSLAAWRATTDRLTSFESSFQAVTLDRSALVAINSEALNIHNVTIQLPDGKALLNHLQWHIAPCSQVLLQGASGSGKSTLFRSIAGIWPYCRGHIERPQDCVFIPQRPYFPNGTLREALAYPTSVQDIGDEALCLALERAQLGHLTGRLDEIAAWGQTLSGGELQRLAIARVLLKPAQWVFADEATSALDETTENIVYKTLLEHIKQAQCTLVSIAHKPTLAIFHNDFWIIEDQQEGAGFVMHRRTQPS